MWIKLFIQRKLLFRQIALLLGCCIFLTACRQEAVPLMDSQITAKDYSSGKGTGSVYQQPLLSEGICVVPWGSNSPTDSAISAGSALMVNDTAGELLFAKNIYKKRYPASVTKIVTALVALKKGNLEDMVTVSYDASHITEYGAKLCGFQEGDQIKLQDLLYSLLIYSGNDAGVAIAEHIGGSVEGFADMMNQEMTYLGASGSHFVNPHGLHEEEHYTTAYDLYLVFHELAKYDVFLDIIGQPEYTMEWQDAQGQPRTMKFTSTDRYLLGSEQAPEDLTVLGGKTGTTIAAGNCLILYSQKGDEGASRYISVILKAASSTALYSQMNHLLEYAD